MNYSSLGLEALGGTVVLSRKATSTRPYSDLRKK